MNAFAALLWSLTVLDVLKPETCADALRDALELNKLAAGETQNHSSDSSPQGMWECSLLYDLLLFAESQTWPSSLLTSYRQAWDHERILELSRIRENAPAALTNLPPLLA